MVKYIHCEKCKKVINTEPWIGEVHTYNGLCPSCVEIEQEEPLGDEKLEIESEKQMIEDITNIEHTEKIMEVDESTQSSQIEIEKKILSNLEQRVNDVLSGGGSIDVLIKEIKLGLVDKARDRIEKTFQSFDVNKIDAQKTVDYVEKTFEYLSEYKDYMDNVIIKIRTKPKMNVKTAIEKVYKDIMSEIPKGVAKDVIDNKKTMLKIVNGKALKWYSIHSDTNDVMDITKKMVLHPFNEIQKKLSTLPFYSPK